MQSGNEEIPVFWRDWWFPVVPAEPEFGPRTKEETERLDALRAILVRMKASRSNEDPYGLD
jgi:hypothetical protein